VVKAGDIVKVKVMAVDVARKRIGLSMRLSDDANDKAAEKPERAEQRRSGQPRASGKPKTSFGSGSAAQGAMAAAFAKAKKR